ncbi:MAG: histidine kinase [Ekhidna sp.]
MFSQTPHHQIIGGEVFSGIDIYGIAQDANQDYWFTTNKGLYSYDGYVFQNYDHPEIKNSSFFNPTIDYQGNVYCSNLSGQIFKVSDGQMSLFHQVPDSLLGSYLSFDFLLDNSLVVNSKSCYRFSNDSIFKLIDKVERGFISASLMRHRDGSLSLHAKENRLFSIDTSQVEEIELETSSQTDFDLFSFFDHKRGPLFGNKGLELFAVSDTVNHTIVLESIFQSSERLSRIYLTENAVWVASDRNGCRRIPLTEKYGKRIDLSGETLFGDYFISYVHEDHEGNILLGTFGTGIIVIPNTSTTNLTSLDHLNASSICSNYDGGILIGTTKGEVYDWTKQELFLIKEQGDKYVQVLEYMPTDDLLFVDQTNFYVYSRMSRKQLAKLSIGAVKDVSKLSGSQFAFATNNRLAVLAWDGKQFDTQYVSNIGRTYAVENIPGTSSLIVASSQGLKKVDSAQVSNVLFNENSILVNDLEATQELVLIATQKHGLLQLGTDGLQSFVEVNDKLLDKNVRQVQVREPYIFLSTEGGFQMFNRLTNEVFSISESDGLSIKKIQDFVVDEESIWFLHQKGIQKMKLQELLHSKNLPSIRDIDAINAADEIISDGIVFEHFENNLKFKIDAQSLRNRNDLTYSYFLDPISARWETNEYVDNKIEYQSLPPGDYTFKVRLNYKKQPVDEASYAFTIRAPFWQTWWFYVLNAFALVFVTYLFFRKRLIDQKRRADEINQLNESKLSALQSQMNPHFIFNALNSIQEYIILNERKLAGKYLGKFADLMRIYLNYSQAKFISLQQEIEALNLYMELEKLRFEELLSYEIELDDSIEMNDQIPSLLIQPYVENALKHGLLHKKDNRVLIVKMVKESDDFLVCSIMDNGIGRKRSMEINKKRNPNHKSFATTATQSRLNLINNGLKKSIGVTTEDLYYPDGEPAGTKVELIIPLFDN